MDLMCVLILQWCIARLATSAWVRYKTSQFLLTWVVSDTAGEAKLRNSIHKAASIIFFFGFSVMAYVQERAFLSLSLAVSLSRARSLPHTHTFSYSLSLSLSLSHSLSLTLSLSCAAVQCAFSDRRLMYSKC